MFSLGYPSFSVASLFSNPEAARLPATTSQRWDRGWFWDVTQFLVTYLFPVSTKSQAGNEMSDFLPIAKHWDAQGMILNWKTKWKLLHPEGPDHRAGRLSSVSLCLGGAGTGRLSHSSPGHNLAGRLLPLPKLQEDTWKDPFLIFLPQKEEPGWLRHPQLLAGEGKMVTYPFNDCGGHASGLLKFLQNNAESGSLWVPGLSIQPPNKKCSRMETRYLKLTWPKYWGFPTDLISNTSSLQSRPIGVPHRCTEFSVEQQNADYGRCVTSFSHRGASSQDCHALRAVTKWE